MNEKLIAYQVAPEHQESPMLYDESSYFDNIVIYGNRDYKPHTNKAFSWFLSYFWTVAGCWEIEYDDEAIRREIADAMDVIAEDVKLMKFDGWTRTAKYKEV